MLTRALLAVLAFLPLYARAADTPRYAHTASLMPSGHMLIVGGIDSGGLPLATAEMRFTGRDGTTADALSMGVARASHTATVMANGRVLVTGGWNGGAVVLNTAQVYDPETNAWAATGNNMSAARMNHTATLLDDGRVLVCGGQIDFTPTVTSLCDTFDPATNLFTATPGNMQQGRAAHTAVLLKNGQVWFAGGWNPGVSPNFLATTERFNPALNSFNSAAPLAQGRAFHTATMSGDGKVLVVGGYNADNSAVNGNNYGVLATAQLYDPVTNSMAPADSLGTRRTMHSATLGSDGLITVMGGLGNVATTYIQAGIDGKIIPTGNFVTVSFNPPTDALTTGTISGGSLALNLALQLGTPVTGIIEDGEVWLASTSVNFTGVQVQFTPASESNPAVGLRIPLSGRAVDCRVPLTAVSQDCGYMSGSFTLSNLQGRLFTSPTFMALADSPPLITAGSIDFAPQPVGSNGSSIVTDGNMTVTTDILVDKAFIGGSIASGTVSLLSSGFTKPSSMTVTLDGGVGTFTSGLIVADATGANGVATVTIVFNDLTGSLAGAASAGSVASPQDITGLPLTGLSGIMRIVPTRVALDGRTFATVTSTMVVRRMGFGSAEFYRPNNNVWDWQPPQGEMSVGSVYTRIGPTATLLPNNDVVFWGGRQTLAGTPLTALPLTTSFVGWGSGGTNPLGARALHTATNLADGTILVAGGTNGPNVLNTAAVFDPEAQTFSATNSSLRDVRDLHTATLLPNGRVLIAGGFTTNETSTGSTSSAEVYYPDTKVFLRTLPMISSRSNHTATLLPDGSVLVAGGFGPDDVITDTAEIFYSTAMAWRSAPVMPEPRTLHTATLLGDGRIMLAGGINSNGVRNTVTAFNTQTGAWSALAPMPIALHSHSATRLLDGRVLVAGGNNGLGEQDVSMIYNPATDSWANTVYAGTSALTMPRFGHNATLLPNGNVLITGGTERFGSITDVHEIFHTPSGSWDDQGRFALNPRRRAFHTMSLAPNGKLYAIGGSDGTIGGTGTLLWQSVETQHLSTTPDVYSKTGTPGLRRSSVTTTSPYPFLPNTLFTVTGSQFKGGTEASGGGAGAANSSFSYPRLTLQSIDGSGGSGTQGNSGFIVDLTTRIYLNPGNLVTLNSSVTVQLPATSAGLPMGWYAARVSANDIHSPSRLVQVGPPKPTAAPAGVASVPMGSSSMSWTWGAVAGVDGYNVYQATTGVFLSTTATTSFVQTELTPNTTASILIAGYTLSGDGPLAAGTTNYTYASTVTYLTIASVTFTSLTLYWNVNENAAGTVYEVSQSTDSVSPFTGSFSTPIPSILNLTTNHVLIENLLPNTTYSFRVRSFSGAGIPSGFSSVVSTLTRTSIDVITYTASLNAIDWGWSNPTGATSFRVYNATTGVLLASPAPGGGGNTNFSDTGLAINSPRSILVSAVTAAGEGPLLPSATVYTLAAPPLIGAPPIAPISTGSLVTNWDINSNPSYTRYRVVYYPSGSTTAVLNALLDGPVVRGGVGGLIPGTLYVSSVAAVNEDDVESAWLVQSTYTLPQEPTNVAVLNTSPVSITVSWDPQQNGPAVHYQVTYSTDQFVTHVATAIPFASGYTGTSTTILGLLTSTTYWIQVQARTPFGTTSNVAPPGATLSTVTFNGGAAPGALAGVISALSPSQIVGSIFDGGLGGTRQIDLRVPAGAFPSDVTMTISSYNAAGLCPNGVGVGISITNAPALQPLKPIYLNFTYATAEVGAIPVNRLVLFRYEPVSGTCVPLETQATADTVRAQINHFSVFQLGQATLATSASTARVFPNPFRKASDSYVTIDNVPPASRVRIFTLRGEQVTDMVANASGLVTWAGTNGAGRAVASGIYLVMVEHGSSKKILKLSLLR